MEQNQGGMQDAKTMKGGLRDENVLVGSAFPHFNWREIGFEIDSRMWDLNGKWPFENEARQDRIKILKVAEWHDEAETTGFKKPILDTPNGLEESTDSATNY